MSLNLNQLKAKNSLDENLSNSRYCALQKTPLHHMLGSLKNHLVPEIRKEQRFEFFVPQKTTKISENMLVDNKKLHSNHFNDCG